MALLRCFTCIKGSDKCKSEGGVALLVHGDENDPDDENHNSKISAARLSLDNHGLALSGNEDRDHLDEEDYTNKLGIRRFNRDEIKRLRRYSCLSWGIGYRGDGEVHFIQLPDSTPVAVKSYGGRQRRFYKHELEILLDIQHENILKLLGYGQDQEEGVLVFEHFAGVNLREKLCSIGETSRQVKESAVLSWRSRVRIAYQLAQAIKYLHEKSSHPIIHGDIRPSNILLNEQLNCKLWNFGSARRATEKQQSSKGHFVLDHPGYTDFDYLSTGFALTQHDIYSLGVIVLELITGVDAPCLHSRGSVALQAESMLRDEDRLVKMLDPRLEQDFALEEARAMASIAAMCLHNSTRLRPSASVVVNEMRSSIHFINV